MTLFTSAIPVWLNITCGSCGHHTEFQLGPSMTIDLEDGEGDYSCSECGSSEIEGLQVSGASNKHMKTLEQVRNQ